MIAWLTIWTLGRSCLHQRQHGILVPPSKIRSTWSENYCFNYGTNHKVYQREKIKQVIWNIYIYIYHTSETTYTSETEPKYQMAIFSRTEHISHKYPIKSHFHTNGNIFTHWAYFTQISNKSYFFTQMIIFLHIEHISHKYPLKLKISHKWSYFHTLNIFYTIILLLSVAILVFWNSWLFMMVVMQVRSFVVRWYSWLYHRDDERRNLIKFIKLFLIDDILDSDDLSFFIYNYLKSFIYCVWNIEHLSNVFC
jgi:hypothetical protein